MTKFQPYVLFPTMGSLREPVLVCGPSFAGAVRAVAARLWYPGSFDRITERVILAHNLPSGVNPTYKLYEKTTCASLIKELKGLMLEFGASPEAVVLVNGVAPFTQEELSTMAKAATATKVAKKADKAEKTPKAAGKPRGNPEALAKAREAGEGKRAEFAAKKIKGLVKLKDAGLREGSGREAKLQALLGAKLVSDVIGTTVTDGNGKEHTVDAGAIHGAVGRGHIELS